VRGNFKYFWLGFRYFKANVMPFLFVLYNLLKFNEIFYFPSFKTFNFMKIVHRNYENFLEYKGLIIIISYMENAMVNNLPVTVIPAKAGIYVFEIILDSRLHGNDNPMVLS
jgi:hypothetical protein